MKEKFDFVVVGGGVAGTICALELCRLQPKASVCLVSPNEMLKKLKIVKRVSNHLDELTVIEQPVGSLQAKNLEFVKDFVTGLKTEEKCVTLSSGRSIYYGKLSVCTGASPKVHASNPRLLTVRDTDSAGKLNKALAQSRKVIVAGNGAIALEIINKLRGVDISWIVKHGHIGDSLLDVDVALFLLECFQKKNKQNVEIKQSEAEMESTQQSIEEVAVKAPSVKPAFDHALGPQWAVDIASKADANVRTNLEVVYNKKLVNVVDKSDDDDGEWPIYALLSSGEKIGADFIISCIGVVPNTSWLSQDASFSVAEDGGLKVDDRMQTSVPDVFAAGDVCTLEGENVGHHFFQIRLWSQARMTAEFAAHCMAESRDAEYLDLCFDLVSGHFHSFNTLARKLFFLF